MIHVAPSDDPNDIALVVDGGKHASELTMAGRTEAQEVAAILKVGGDQPPEASRDFTDRMHRLVERDPSQ